MLASDNVRALADARAALEKAQRVGDPSLVAAVIACLGQIEMWAGEVTPGLLEQGAELEQHERLTLGFLTSPRFWLARLRVRQGQLPEARGMLATLEAEAVARGDEQTHVHVLWCRSILEWFDGNWEQSLELAGEAYDVGEQTQFPNNHGWQGRMKALIEADLGLVEQARASAEEGVAETQAFGNEMFRILCVSVLGRLELALGNVEAAAGYLSGLPGQLRALGLNDPTQPVWADAIEVLVALGELDQAAVYVEAYEQTSQRVDSAWAAACATRCRALLNAAEGDLASAFDGFGRALAQLQKHPFPLERGRTLLCLGVVRRQALQRRAAREALEQALAIFEELGARLWSEKARAELARISGRRADGDELTATEIRVAELAAGGRSNREIAAELFMGVSTVEAHLSRVYRKLGIRSRAGLGTWATTATDAVANPVEGAPQS
jgi:DNA-binding CsgD family transcriptional regulator